MESNCFPRGSIKEGGEYKGSIEELPVDAKNVERTSYVSKLELIKIKPRFFA